jgi:tRNA isopentenyl-2-thiomethyl-A-37 hydroxylase MiaE
MGRHFASPGKRTEFVYGATRKVDQTGEIKMNNKRDRGTDINLYIHHVNGCVKHLSTLLRHYNELCKLNSLSAPESAKIVIDEMIRLVKSEMHFYDAIGMMLSAEKISVELFERIVYADAFERMKQL